MSRSRKILHLIAALLLLGAGLGTVAHTHDDPGKECRLCQQVRDPELPTSAVPFLDELVESSPPAPAPRPRLVSGVLLTPVGLRAPPGGSLTG